MRDHRILIRHADAMDVRRVAPGVIGIGDPPRPLRELPEAEPGLQERHIMVDLLVGQPIETTLLIAGAARPAEVAAADAGTIAEGTDQIGVEADQLAGANPSVAEI